MFNDKHWRSRTTTCKQKLLAASRYLLAMVVPPQVGDENRPASQCASNYETVSRELVTIRGAPIGIAGFLEEATAIDTSVVTHRCVLPWVFVYPYRLDSHRLKRALAASLEAHPVLSGRILPARRLVKRPDGYLRKFQLVHSNDGVEFVDAVSNLSVGSFVERKMTRKNFSRRSPPPAYFEDMDRWKVLQGRDPLLRVKLVQLAGGGSLLAVTALHVAVDGKSFVRFMQHWAANYRGDLDSIIPPFLNRMVLEPATIEASLMGVKREQKPSTIGPIPPQQQSKPISDTEVNASRRTCSDPTHYRLPQCEIEVDEETRSEEGHGSSRGSHWLEVPQPSILGAFSALRALSSSFSRERHRFPKMVRELTTVTLRLPEQQLCRLKSLATAACAPNEYLSTNDCVSALLWTAMCDLRARPLPGASSVEDNKGRFSLAVDLRHNGLEHCVPENFFGNGSWSIQIEGGKDIETVEKENKDENGGDEDESERAFCWAAKKVRSGILNFRGDEGAPVELLKSIRAVQEASLSSKVMVVSETLLNFDAFMTSWQFPIWDVDFGFGGPCNFKGIMHPTPPFHGILYPSHPADKGLSLDITVPTSAVDTLCNSQIIRHLVPKAFFIS